MIAGLPDAINGWTISVAAYPNALAPGATTNIHAVTNMDVGPTPYYIQIYDTSVNQWLNTCWTGTTCDAYPSQGSPTTHTFTAYVANNANPPGSVQAQASVNVTWLSVGLNSNTCCVGTGGTISVTASANTDVGPTPWYIEIFDYYSHARVAICPSGSSCTYNASQGTAGSRTFIAFVSNSSTSYPPGSIQAQSGTLTVTWVSVSLSASPQYLSAGGTTTLTASANADITRSPYYIGIYNSSAHAYLTSCGVGSSCHVSVSYGSATAQNYVAYISTNGSGFPPPNVQAMSNTVYVAWYTISLSDGGAQYVRPGDPISLTATATPDVGATPTEYIEIYEARPGGYLTRCATGGNCGPYNYYGSPGAHTFVAYVSNLDVTNYPPSGTVATSNAVAATWVTVTIAASRSSLPDGSSVTLTANANTTLSGPHEWLQMFDQAGGVELGSCQNCGSLSVGQSYGSAQAHNYFAEIVTDLGGGMVQATSSTIGVTWFQWGVDSCDTVSNQYSGTVSGLGKPEFWGRYIGSGGFCDMQVSDATFAHNNGIRILPIYTDGGASNLTSTAAGQQAAQAAVSAAQSLGIPAGTAIMLDIEAPSIYPTVNAGALQGWADTIAGAGYKPGFYQYSGNPFASAFCSVVSDPNVAGAILWTTQPNTGRAGVGSAPGFGPSPLAGCGYGNSSWQYYTNPPAPNSTTPNVDDDEALAGVPMW